MNSQRLATGLALLWLFTGPLPGGTVFPIHSGAASLAIQLNAGKWGVALFPILTVISWLDSLVAR